MGTFVAIVLELVAIGIAVWRGQLYLGPRPAKLAVAALGLVSIILLGWQGWRVTDARRGVDQQAQKDAQAIRKAQDDADQARIEAQQYEQRVMRLGTNLTPPSGGGSGSSSQASKPAGASGTSAGPALPARTLTEVQKTELQKLFKKMGSHGIVVRYATDNDEAQRYADAFASVLRDAGWTFRQPKFISWSQEPRGLVILVPDLTDVPKEADEFALSLNKVGLEVKWQEESSLDAGTFDLMVGAQ